MTTTDVKDIFVPTGTFDKTRLRVLDPVTHSFTKGDSEIEWTTSEGRYIDDDGEECELFFELPEQFCFGINAVYPVGTAKEDKHLENIVGLQICYPLTGMKTIENPTKDEKYIQRVFQALWQVAWDKMQVECEKEELLVPNPTYNSYLAAQKRKNPEMAVKPVFAFPQKTDPKNSKKKVEDRSKPRRVYAKLLTKGNGRKMRCITQIYGPGDKQDKTGLRYMDKRGKVHPLFKWEGVFWGSHGQKAPYGASIRLRIAQMNFTPQSEGVPKRRMLAPNSAPPEEDDSSDDEGAFSAGGSHDDAGGEDEGFAQPGDDENPMDALDGSDEEGSGSGGQEEADESDEEVEIEESSPPKKAAKPKTSAKSAVEKRKAALLKKRAAAKAKAGKKRT